MKQWGMYAEMLQTQVEETGHADGAELEEDEVLFPILSSHPPLPTLRHQLLILSAPVYSPRL